MSRARDETRLYLVSGASTEPEHDMPPGPAQDALDRAKWALAQSKAQSLAGDAGAARQATAGDLEGRLSAAGRLLRTRPPGDAAEWTAEHSDELAEAVAVGGELAWRGHAEQVAADADPAIRTARHDAPPDRSGVKPDPGAGPVAPRGAARTRVQVCVVLLALVGGGSW